MRDGVIEVAPGRYCETFGRYYEGFSVGDEFAAKTEFGKPLICSPLTVRLMADRN